MTRLMRRETEVTAAFGALDGRGQAEELVDAIFAVTFDVRWEHPALLLVDVMGMDDVPSEKGRGRRLRIGTRMAMWAWFTSSTRVT